MRKRLVIGPTFSVGVGRRPVRPSSRQVEGLAQPPPRPPARLGPGAPVRLVARLLGADVVRAPLSSSEAGIYPSRQPETPRFAQNDMLRRNKRLCVFAPLREPSARHL